MRVSFKEPVRQQTDEIKDTTMRASKPQTPSSDEVSNEKADEMAEEIAEEISLLFSLSWNNQLWSR